jgi:hypothetical protein
MVLDPDVNRREYEANAAFLDGISGLPAVEGTVDLYTVSQSRVITKGYAYSPRPIFQSYNLWTQGLADLNADHLRGPRAPDVVFYDLATIDGRLPSQDDAASWLPLLERYEGVGFEGACYMLRRAVAPRRVTLHKLSESTVALGDPVDIPPTDSGPVWLSVTVTPTAFGSLARALFRSAAVWVDVDTPEPLVKSRFRILPATSARGFVISPLVLDSRDLPFVFGGEPFAGSAPVPVRRVRILADQPMLAEYQPSVRVAVYRVEVACESDAAAQASTSP